jgi:hypothetical protein
MDTTTGHDPVELADPRHKPTSSRRRRTIHVPLYRSEEWLALEQRHPGLAASARDRRARNCEEQRMDSEQITRVLIVTRKGVGQIMLGG